MPFLNQSLINSKDKILIAFSGGKDSVVLLDLLSKYLNKENLAIAHIDHQIRDTSYKDAIFSKEVAKKYGINYFEEQLNLKNLSSNTEAIAREKRYKALYLIANKNGYNKIATAHTKSDNIEQFFIRLYRGTSLSGLAGISEYRGIIVRPILDYTTEDIKNYIKEHNLTHIFDETNSQNIYLRNKIRNTILPSLYIENYDLDTHIINLMSQIKRDNEYFNEIINKFINQNIYFANDCLFFNRKLHDELPETIKYKLMNVLLYRFFNINSSYNKITEIIELTKTENEVSQISKDINFYATKNFIAISKENNKFFTLKEIEIIFNLIKNEITYFQNCELDNLLIDENIKLINFKNGDKFQKYNNKEVKFKDIFIDHKIPLFLRKKWPLLSINNKIIAIPFIEKGYYYNPINNKK